jgi:hypothetical protein
MSIPTIDGGGTHRSEHRNLKSDIRVEGLERCLALLGLDEAEENSIP